RRGAETIVHLRRLRDTLHARCKLPRTLAETGKLERTALRTLAERALDDGPVAFNPREADLEDMIGICDRAWG
ncbi:MAG: alcohol dehydrogenase, partial [Myxococcales bacterium]|nr:alcohol dehydrogenase [Myxococcales bacterium]